MRYWLTHLHQHLPGSRAITVLGLALTLSLSINVAGMIRYRKPHFLWSDNTYQAPPRPMIELSFDRLTQPPNPLLAAPAQFETVQHLRRWQTQGREKLLELLGVPLPTDVPTVRLADRQMVGKVVRETLVFKQTDGMEVPAFLLRPDSDQPRPGLLVIPGHSQGILSTAGLFLDYQNAMALRFAEAGYVVLTMEVRGFGYLHPDNTPNAIEHSAYTGYCLVYGITRLGLTVGDGVAGLNYLTTRPEVIADRIGIVGFSSGCDAAIYLGALDTRASAIIADGCVCSHESNFRFSQNDPYEAVPALANWLEMSDCLGLLSPRPVLVHWGKTDSDPATRSAAFNRTSLTIFEAARRIYEADGHADRLEKAITPSMAHEFDVDVALEFLRRQLPMAERNSFPALR